MRNLRDIREFSMDIGWLALEVRGMMMSLDG